MKKRVGIIVGALVLVALPLSLVGIDRSSSGEEEAAPQPLVVEKPAGYREYLKRVDGLRKQERWRQLVAFGEQALEEGEALTSKERAEIHCQMSSCYFYLGDFCAAGYHAMSCVDWARKGEDSALEVAGLSRQGAVERARAHRRLHGSSFRRAITLSEEALHLYCHRELDEPLILAKVYYNLAAACADDPCGHFAKAANAYQEALALYREYGTDELVSRTVTRFALCHLQMGHHERAEGMLREIVDLNRSQRAEGHYEFCWARLSRAQGKIYSARQWGERALARARMLDARADMQRVQAFLDELDLESDAPLAIR